MRTALYVVKQAIFCVFFCSKLVFAQDYGKTKETVYSLQQVGWEVSEKKVCYESHPGISPYLFLSRILSITTYRLYLHSEQIICKITYDSQLDRQYEKCGERHPVPVPLKVLDCQPDD